jgi:hypothetical protein
MERNPNQGHAVKGLTLGETQSLEITVDAHQYRTVTFAGRAVYEDGRPAPGIQLYAWGMVDESAESHGSAVTASDGTYRLVVMKEVPHTIVVWKAPDGWVARARESAPGKLGQVIRVPDIIFTRGAAVKGTVLDQRTGKPLANAYVSSFGPHRPKSTLRPTGVKTDAAGRYTLRVAHGSCQVHWDGPFRCDVFERVFGIRRFDGEEIELDQKITPLELKAGETKQLDFRVDGSLLDPDRK